MKLFFSVNFLIFRATLFLDDDCQEENHGLKQGQEMIVQPKFFFNLKRSCISQIIQNQGLVLNMTG